MRIGGTGNIGGGREEGAVVSRNKSVHFSPHKGTHYTTQRKHGGTHVVREEAFPVEVSPLLCGYTHLSHEVIQ